MTISLKLSHKALILVAVPLVFELIFLITLTVVLKQADYEIWRERHSKGVIAESNSLLKNFVDSGFFLYMYGTSGQEAFLHKYKDLAEQIPIQIRSLKVMIRDSPDQENSLKRLESVSNHSSKLLAECSRIVSDNRAIKRFGDEKENLERMLSELSSELRNFVREQEKIEQINPQDEARSRLLLTLCLAFGVILNIVLAIFLALYFNRGTTRRLQILMDNAERLAKGQDLRKRISGNDEISKLDNVFHNMAEALAEAAKRKQELVSMVSHDLRSPLTSVQASLTILCEGVFGNLPSRAQKEVINAEANTNRLIGLINDLLDIEKMADGQLRIECQSVPVSSIFEKSVQTVEALANSYNVKVQIEKTELMMYADADRIIQIIVNLLSNSIKFSPSDSTVTVKAIARDNLIEIQVSDQGRGIPEQFKKLIFERFQQIEIADSKNRKGTGLGLSICKSLVDLHRGQIGVESEEGKGSTFWFRIPLKA